ncbi:hypothetical protein A0H81_12887 [Grifola frondosa]|uniref:Uncharacterized protein n=1 Tax=Grifola frondosa TaxID=5627 RepID=A0A1C7LSQ8_GRIFR|nr:hypothetical protein A0H81_12887 [Grifola frondosa]
MCTYHLAVFAAKCPCDCNIVGKTRNIISCPVIDCRDGSAKRAKIQIVHPMQQPADFTMPLECEALGHVNAHT